MMAWLALFVCIALEVAATTLLKVSDGFARPGPATASLALYGVTFWLLAWVFTRLPVGVSYAVWSGVGVAAITLIGWLAFKQSLNGLQMLFLALILVGAVGLNLTTGSTPPDGGG
ncbi:ligand-binding protein SH3 [Rhodothalassium salexigens]|uniref:DMT family transporter n=1 Tax=Rhodothalassium salexigens TaxID=1086 RepID=UPI0019125517|nr:multidrug efflux SMR transporter [Rhodothalassium salexigens]MBK5921115.1 ligand-binding protein SH3 [Rhodothalassium salexigens]